MGAGSAPLTCEGFLSALSSRAPTPGGGGAAALTGAVAAALGGMVCSLTEGKAGGAEAEAEIAALKEKCARLQSALYDQIAADAEGFAPLAAAWRLPRDAGRDKAVAYASVIACAAPMRVMALCGEVLSAVSVCAEKGSRLAVSDAGCAAACARAALESAALNVFINTRSLPDREKAQALNDRCRALLDRYVPLAESVYEGVRAELARGTEGT